mgnify:CR=1 FL=1|tara:strand:- start:24 stop:1352 length:1329 start_codon:yes stop_codon:yes gene_type:complete
MASTYLSRTPSSTGNRRTFTISMWMKRSKIGNNQKVFTAGTSGTESGLQFYDGSTENTLRFYEHSSSSDQFVIAPNRLLRDTNAWYHIVIAVDTTQATASNRVKYYVNGVQETSFATATYPSQNYDTLFNLSGTVNTVGFLSGHSAYFDGLMSHVHFIDGTAYDASAFGSTDSTTGEWKINTSPSVTYGTNGFFILKDGNSGTDQSGQSNNLTVSGTLTNTEDCPSNVFATINPLYKHSATYANGNLKSTNASNKFGGVSSIGVSTGKYYAEFKYGSASNQNGAVGIYGNPQLASNNNQGVGKEANSYSYRSDDGNKVIENTGSAYGNTFASGNIISIALDLDNNKLYFAKDGVWQNSGDPTSGSTGTGAIDISLTPTDGCWFIAANCNSGSDTAVWEHNYGNGYFGTTAISSEGTNASGIGKFEYDVPAGYTALSTKGLNE